MMSISKVGEHKKPGRSLMQRCLALILLFSAWPMLNFMHRNLYELSIDGALEILKVFAITVAIASSAFFTIHYITRRGRPIAVAITIVIGLLLFFNYHMVYAGIVSIFSALKIPRGENYAYALLFLALCLLSILFSNKRGLLTGFLVFGGVASALPALGISYHVLSRLTPESNVEPLGGHIAGLDKPFVRSPHVFHLILDAYARSDSLKTQTGWDNTEFRSELEERGFYIADKSYSNYPQSYVSISSTLEAKYLITEDTQPLSSKVGFYRSIQGDNASSQYFQKQEYRRAYLGSGSWDGSKCSDSVDLCLSSSNAIEQALLYLTPLRRFVLHQRTTVADVESRLDRIMRSDQPTYTFIHLMIPHPPRAFDSECELLKIRGTGPVTDFWGDQEGYVNDIGCLNSKLLSLIDEIIARDPGAIIVLHGDHGSAFQVDWSLPLREWPEAQAEERFAILMGLRLPEQCMEHLYEEFSPVNIYPVIFACLQGDKPQLQPDKYYVTVKEEHPEFGIGFPYQLNNSASR